MIKFVVHTDAYLDEAATMEVFTCPSEPDFLLDFLKLEDVDWEELDVDIDQFIAAELEVFEQTNGDGRPYVMVINVDTEEVIIGG